MEEGMRSEIWGPAFKLECKVRGGWCSWAKTNCIRFISVWSCGESGLERMMCVSKCKEQCWWWTAQESKCDSWTCKWSRDALSIISLQPFPTLYFPCSPPSFLLCSNEDGAGCFTRGWCCSSITIVQVFLFWEDIKNRHLQIQFDEVSRSWLIRVRLASSCPFNWLNLPWSLPIQCFGWKWGRRDPNWQGINGRLHLRRGQEILQLPIWF